MSLTPRVTWGSLDLTDYPYALIFGADFGSPESVVQTLVTFLQDGEYEISDRSGNRTFTLPILTEGTDLAELAAAEAALVLEARKPLNTLTIDPGDGYAQPTAFDTFAGTVALSRDDEHEKNSLRVWDVTISALPFGRDVAATTVQATSGQIGTTLATTVIDSGSSATGWSALNATAPTSSSGMVRSFGGGAVPTAAFGLTRFGGFSVTSYSGPPVLIVDWKSDSSNLTIDNARASVEPAGGSPYEVARGTDYSGTSPAAGFTRSAFNLNNGLFYSPQLFFQTPDLGVSLSIDRMFVLYRDSSGVVQSGAVDEASSTANWLPRNGSPVTYASGAVSTTAAGAGYGPAYLVRTGAIDLSGMPFVYVDWSGNATADMKMFVTASGVEREALQFATGTAPTAGFNRTYFQSPLTQITSVRFGFDSGFPAYGQFSIDQVCSTNRGPGSGTDRQRYRSLTIGGSARARAALSISADAGSTLGDLTILYTAPSTGMHPPLRPYRTSSSSIAADAASISGAYNSFLTPMIFNIPASKFREAAHDLVLRLRATTAGTYSVTWTAALASSSNADLPETAQLITGTTVLTFAAANAWQTNEVGLLQLPTIPVAADSTHSIRVTLLASSANLQLDDGWLFDLDNGVLSWVNTTGLTRLEVRTADLSTPRPSVWGGTADGGSAAGLVRADWRTVAYGTHVFEPGTTDIFTVTSGTEGSSAQASYYRAWHTHAASS